MIFHQRISWHRTSKQLTVGRQHKTLYTHEIIILINLKAPRDLSKVWICRTENRQICQHRLNPNLPTNASECEPLSPGPQRSYTLNCVQQILGNCQVIALYSNVTCEVKPPKRDILLPNLKLYSKTHHKPIGWAGGICRRCRESELSCGSGSWWTSRQPRSGSAYGNR